MESIIFGNAFLEYRNMVYAIKVGILGYSKKLNYKTVLNLFVFV